MLDQISFRQISFFLCCFTFCLATTFAARANVIEPQTDISLLDAYSSINLNPGGIEAFEGLGSRSTEVEWGRQGFNVRSTTSGETFRGEGTALGARARVEMIVTQEGRGNTRTASAEAQVTYYVSVLPVGPAQPGLDTIDLELTSFSSRIGAPVDSFTDTSAIGSLQVSNALTDEVYIDDNTNLIGENDSFLDAAYNSGEVVTVKYFLNDQPVTRRYEVRLSAFALGAVRSNLGETAIAESFMDPIFAFDQAAYDARRALDPSLPDVQLNEVFTFGISGNVFTPVPLPPAVILFTAGLIPLIRLRRAV